MTKLMSLDILRRKEAYSAHRFGGWKFKVKWPYVFGPIEDLLQTSQHGGNACNNDYMGRQKPEGFRGWDYSFYDVFFQNLTKVFESSIDPFEGSVSNDLTPFYEVPPLQGTTTFNITTLGTQFPAHETLGATVRPHLKNSRKWGRASAPNLRDYFHQSLI